MLILYHVSSGKHVRGVVFNVVGNLHSRNNTYERRARESREWDFVGSSGRGLVSENRYLQGVVWKL